MDDIQSILAFSTTLSPMAYVKLYRLTKELSDSYQLPMTPGQALEFLIAKQYEASESDLCSPLTEDDVLKIFAKDPPVDDKLSGDLMTKIRKRRKASASASASHATRKANAAKEETSERKAEKPVESTEPKAEEAAAALEQESVDTKDASEQTDVPADSAPVPASVPGPDDVTEQDDVPDDSDDVTGDVPVKSEPAGETGAGEGDEDNPF